MGTLTKPAPLGRATATRSRRGSVNASDHPRNVEASAKGPSYSDRVKHLLPSTVADGQAAGGEEKRQDGCLIPASRSSEAFQLAKEESIQEQGKPPAMSRRHTDSPSKRNGQAAAGLTVEQAGGDPVVAPISKNVTSDEQMATVTVTALQFSTTSQVGITKVPEEAVVAAAVAITSQAPEVALENIYQDPKQVITSTVTELSPCAECKTNRIKTKEWEKAYHDMAYINERHAEHKAKIEKENEAFVREIDGLNIENANLRDILAESAQRNKQQVNISSGSAFVSDTDIESRWIKLVWAIRQCVDENLLPLAQPSESSSPYQHLRHLTPEYASLIRDKAERSLLAQAAIWSVLATRMFPTRDQMSWMCWAGKAAADLRSLSEAARENPLENNAKALHNWRCHSASFFGPRAVPADIEPHATRLLLCMDEMLKHLLSNSKGKLQKSLLDIIDDAIRLDEILCAQRAYWYVHYPYTNQFDNYGYDFDEATMKLPGNAVPEGPLRVTLMISPALVKAGDSRGDHYDSNIILCKSLVYAAVSPPKVPPRKTSANVALVGVPSVVDPRTAGIRQEYRQNLRDKRNEKRQVDKLSFFKAAIGLT